jgi:hypothetical protein
LWMPSLVTNFFFCSFGPKEVAYQPTRTRRNYRLC